VKVPVATALKSDELANAPRAVDRPPLAVEFVPLSVGRDFCVG
jgi:hypothetical protein